MTSGRVAIGAVTGVHGVKGQFKVKPFTEAPRDIASYGPVLAGDRQLTLVVKGVASNGMVIVAAAEITDRDAAQALRGTELTVARGNLPAPEGDEVYHADLIGLAAETPDGALLGRLVALHDFGAGEIAEVKPEKGPSVMLPFGPDYVPQIDLEGGRVVIAPPDGLLEMAAAAGSPPEDGRDG